MALLAALAAGAAPVPAPAQSMEGTGVVPTGLLLRQLEGVKRVLMIGAHPDDEDTSLLTLLARGRGAETAYLALTRGDGGQNLIGGELWEGLGVIRTGELEAARGLDGGRQFFTSAFDFGYSKTAEEALTLWPRDELLAEVTWVVRRFRPHVIVSVFSGTPRDGHGQHQAAGIMAREVFQAAGDPERFPEHFALGVEPWTPSKLYVTAFRRFFGDMSPDGEDGEVVVETGSYDPLLGRSFFQLSMESRSQHRSQDMGASQPLGPRRSGAVLLESRVEGNDDLFAGIDTTLLGVTAGLPPGPRAEARGHLERFRTSVARAREGFRLDPGAVAPHLADGLTHLRRAREAADGGGPLEFRTALDRKIDVATRAYLAAAGVVVDVRADDPLVVPGQTVTVRVQVWNGGSTPVTGAAAALRLPNGWTATPTGMEGLAADGALAPGQLAEWTYEVAIPASAAPSRLYYLRAPRDGARYDWPAEPALWGLPRDPASVHATVDLRAPGTTLESRVSTGRPWRYVGVDQARGEYAEPVLVVPALSVRVAPGGLVWPLGLDAARTVTAVLRNQSDDGAAGELTLRAPAGWTVTPASASFELGVAGAERSVSFEVRPGVGVTAGEHVFRAVARVDGTEYAEGYAIIDYEHIERAALYEPAVSNVTVVPLAVTPDLRVGYIMGTGDDGPEAIRQMGASVELLTEQQVRDGAFAGFDVLVLGVRAYEARDDVRAVNQQILDFARAGGVVVNQYNQYQFSSGAYAPHTLEIARPAPRVADETAPVTILEPDAPVFARPNAIGPADFEGWVQERGLYFPSTWDAAYTPLLEMADPGEEPHRGSLLVAPVGDGLYVHASLSFFRQWAGRVPGAYRLFANLVSLDPEAWAEWLRGR